MSLQNIEAVLHGRAYECSGKDERIRAAAMKMRVMSHRAIDASKIVVTTHSSSRPRRIGLVAAFYAGNVSRDNTKTKMKGVFTLSRFLCLTALAGAAQATFDCRPTIELKDRKGDTRSHFDLQPLSGLRTASKTTETPPTTNEAKVSMTLCGDDVLTIDDKIAEEDQVRTDLLLLSLNEVHLQP